MLGGYTTYDPMLDTSDTKLSSDGEGFAPRILLSSLFHGLYTSRGLNSMAESDIESGAEDVSSMLGISLNRKLTHS